MRTWITRVAFIAGGSMACGWSADLESLSRTRDTPSPPPTIVDERPPDPPEEGRCELGSLSFGPSDLPAAVLGHAYEVDAADYAEEGWRGASYSASSLPEWLAASKSGVYLSGVPTETGTFQFTIYAVHDATSDGCSIMPDPHTFRIEVTATAADAGADASADVELPRPPK